MVMTNQGEQFAGDNIGTDNGTDQQETFLPNSSNKVTLLQKQSPPHHRRMNKPFLSLSHQQQGGSGFATEIGDEIKRMQVLLQEKNDSLATLSLENVDAYQEMNRLTNQLKQSHGALERGKEEIWALELEKQEFIQQINDLQQQVKRASVDQTRLIGHEKNLKQELENMKQQQVIWQDNMEKAKHDKRNLAATRRKLFALERQLPEYDAATDLPHTSEGSDFDDDTNTLSTRPSPPPNPTPSQFLPLASFAKKARHHRQQHDQFIAINSELHASLTISNDTIKRLQHTLEDEQKKRMEMERLWREAQELIEKNNNSSISISTNDMTTTPYSPSADYEHHNESQQHHHQLQSLPRFGVQCDSGKQSRRIRKKCLSLGDELILAGTSDNTMRSLLYPADIGNTEGGHKNGNTTAPPTVGISWTSEQVSIHTNLDEIMGIGHSQHVSSDLSRSNSKIDNKTNATFAMEKRQPHRKYENEDNSAITYHGNSNTTGTDQEPPERYGSLLTTESYIYQPSTRKRLSSQQHQRHENWRSNSSIICDTITAESPDTKQDGTGYIRALTRTMIGDWMWKYTRKMVGSGISEYKHKRFCWLHPYSRTLYWSAQEPGVDGCEHVTKCVMIESFKVLNNGGVSCFLIQTRGRPLKIQCKDNATYSIWFKSLKYLLIDAPSIGSPLLTTTKNKGTDTQRLNTLTKDGRSSNLTGEKHLVKHQLSTHHHPHENLERPSSSSSTNPCVTMSSISPASTYWHTDSALSSATMAGSSSISLPFLPQKWAPSLPLPTTTVTATYRYPSFSNDNGARFNNGLGSLASSSLNESSQAQVPSWLDFDLPPT